MMISLDAHTLTVTASRTTVDQITGVIASAAQLVEKRAIVKQGMVRSTELGVYARYDLSGATPDQLKAVRLFAQNLAAL